MNATQPVLFNNIAPRCHSDGQLSKQLRFINRLYWGIRSRTSRTILDKCGAWASIPHKPQLLHILWGKQFDKLHWFWNNWGYFVLGLHCYTAIKKKLSIKTGHPFFPFTMTSNSHSYQPIISIQPTPKWEGNGRLRLRLWLVWDRVNKSPHQSQTLLHNQVYHCIL